MAEPTGNSCSGVYKNPIAYVKAAVTGKAKDGTKLDEVSFDPDSPTDFVVCMGSDEFVTTSGTAEPSDLK